MYASPTTQGLAPTISESVVPQTTVRTEGGRTFTDICGYDECLIATCPQHGERCDAGLVVPLSTLDFCAACLHEASRRPAPLTGREPFDQRALDFDRANPLEAGRGIGG